MMTSAQLRPQHPALPSARRFLVWLERARPGETLLYHRGLLAHDRSNELIETERRAIARVADVALAAAEAGCVHLVQRRHGPGDFTYLAIKAVGSRSRRGVAMDLAAARPSTSCSEAA